jgi:alcohol dehydrogenase
MANVTALSAAGADHPALGRYAAIGRDVSGDCTLGNQEAIDMAIRFCRDLSLELQISRLGKFGVTEAHVNAMVELAKKASSMRFNPVMLSDTALAEIISDAL